MAGRLRHNRHRRPADTATTPCSGRAVFDDPQSPPCSPRTMRPAPPPSHTVPGTVDGAQGLSLTGGGGETVYRGEGGRRSALGVAAGGPAAGSGGQR